MPARLTVFNRLNNKRTIFIEIEIIADVLTKNAVRETSRINTDTGQRCRGGQQNEEKRKD